MVERVLLILLLFKDDWKEISISNIQPDTCIVFNVALRVKVLFRCFLVKLHSRSMSTLLLIERYGLFSVFIQRKLCYEMKTIGRNIVTSSPFLYNKEKKEILNKFESASVNSKSFGNNGLTKSIQAMPNQIIAQRAWQTIANQNILKNIQRVA